MNIEELKALLTGNQTANAAALAALQGEIKTLRAAVDDTQLKIGRAALFGGQRGGQGKATDAEIAAEHKAIGALIKDGIAPEFKGLDGTVGPSGGYLVDTVMSRAINQKIFDQSPIRRLARVQPIEAGDAWEEPVDFSDLGAEWVGETTARPETSNPDLGMLTIPLEEVYAHQTVTQKLLDLSFVNIGQWIEGKIADKFGRTEGLAYVSGNGVKKPKGFLTYATSALTDATRPLWSLQYLLSGAATAITADALKNVYWGLRAPYRPNSSWLMASETANAIDKLKDGNGNYLWRMGMTAGAPPELLGRPVEFDENMPAVGAGNYPIAFADWKKGYAIVDWNGVKPLRDPYTSKPNVIFYVYRRTGGGVSNSEAIKLLQIGA